MVSVMIDTREPLNIYEAARATKLPWVRMTLTMGDFASDRVIWERKKIGDLCQSIYTHRLRDQLDRMYGYCQRQGKIIYLFVHGSIRELAQQFSERKQKLNPNALDGAIASTMVRYDANILWVVHQHDKEKEALKHALMTIWKVCEKVEEGKLGMARRKNLKEYSYDKRVAVVCNALRVGPKLAQLLVKKFGGLFYILYAIKETPEKILVMPGVGPATYKRMKMMAGLD